VQLTWLGHSTVLVEAAGLRLLTDPALGRRVGFLRRLAPPIADGAFKEVDAVLLSHLHGDHTDEPSLARVGETVAVVGAPAVAEWLRARGRSGARALAPGEGTAIGGVRVEATPARHDGRRWPRGPAADAVGFLVEAQRSIYFAGDTDLFPEMAALTGRVDVALLPVWGWGPTLGPGHLDPERAAEAAATIRPRVAIPVHWGTLGVPWARPDRAALRRPAEQFAAAVARHAPDVGVHVLEPGETIALEEVVRA
jgi:L-ascorbate metabolism protein UlaG (beta-lactamase superfamily)